MDVKELKSSTEKSLSKVTFVGQATGLQCFAVNAESLQSTSAVSRNHKLFLLLNLTFLIGQSFLMAFDVYVRNNNEKRSGIRTGQMIQFTVYSLALSVASVSTMNNYLLRGKAKEMFRNCFHISDILSLLNQSADYASFERQFKITSTILFLSWILTNIALMIFIYNYHTQRTSLLTGTIAVYIYFMVTVLISYWTLLIRLVRENLRFIRECLVQLNAKHQLFRLHPDPDVFNSNLRIRRIQEMYDVIGKLKKMYAIVHDLTALVNELIGLPICVFMVLVVTANISGGYRIFLAINGDVPFTTISAPLCTMYTCSITLVTLVVSCSSTYSIVEEILSHVHKFEFNKFERDAGLSMIALEFTCQIVQRPIEFKVGGFCRLTQPILASIITGIFTYVMLLVQFYSPSPK